MRATLALNGLNSANVLDKTGTNFDGVCSKFMIKNSWIDFHLSFDWSNEEAKALLFSLPLQESQV